MRVAIKNVAADSPERMRVFRLVEKAIRDFQGLRIETVTSACNARRQWLQEQLSPEFLIKYNLGHLSVRDAEKELASAFDLKAPPDEMLVDFSVPTNARDPKCAMSTSGNVIYVHMSVIDDRAGHCPTVNMSVEDTTLHEMLHVCGDVDSDGVIRHNWAGVIPIRQALVQANTGTSPS